MAIRLNGCHIKREDPSVAATTEGSFCAYHLPANTFIEFLFHIFECLIHRNLLDPLEIKYHNHQISDQHKSKHLCIA